MIDENEYTMVRLPSKLYDEIECKVVSLYKEFGITSVPINPFEIASKRGYIIKPFSAYNHSSQIYFRQKGLDGTNYYDPELHTFVICYDDSKGYDRIRFTLMHEIGHIDMGHREESELARKIADYYAAYALVPSPIVSLMECEDYMDISYKFRVSPDCADICFQRYTNWQLYSGKYKPYEKDLIGLFK